MTVLKVIGALLGAVACVIPYLALTEEYERALVAEPRDARVLSVDGDVVRYEIHDPGSQWDDDGDGWIGPYSDEDVPESARAALSAGDSLVVRSGQLELGLAPPTPLLLVGAFLCLLLAAWFVVGPILERRAVNAARADPMRLIELMLRKTRAQKVVAATLLFVMGAGLAAVGVLAGEELWQQIFIGALGAIAIALAAFTAYGAWQVRSPANAPVLRAIREEPERIVWIYEYVLTVNGVPTHHLYVCRDDGERYEFNLGQLPADDLIASLARVVPHAVIGYSEERKQVYSRSPGNFRANAGAMSAA